MTGATCEYIADSPQRRDIEPRGLTAFVLGPRTYFSRSQQPQNLDSFLTSWAIFNALGVLIISVMGLLFHDVFGVSGNILAVWRMNILVDHNNLRGWIVAVYGYGAFYDVTETVSHADVAIHFLAAEYEQN